MCFCFGVNLVKKSDQSGCCGYRFVRAHGQCPIWFNLILLIINLLAFLAFIGYSVSVEWKELDEARISGDDLRKEANVYNLIVPIILVVLSITITAKFNYPNKVAATLGIITSVVTVIVAIVGAADYGIDLVNCFTTPNDYKAYSKILDKTDYCTSTYNIQPNQPEYSGRCENGIHSIALGKHSYDVNDLLPNVTICKCIRGNRTELEVSNITIGNDKLSIDDFSKRAKFTCIASDGRPMNTTIAQPPSTISGEFVFPKYYQIHSDFLRKAEHYDLKCRFKQVQLIFQWCIASVLVMVQLFFYVTYCEEVSNQKGVTAALKKYWNLADVRYRSVGTNRIRFSRYCSTCCMRAYDSSELDYEILSLARDCGTKNMLFSHFFKTVMFLHEKRKIDEETSSI